MHIPDGYLSPVTYLPLFAVAGLGVGMAAKKLKAGLAARHVPYVAMAAAFSFLIQMFNIPVPGGAAGHATGGAIIALLLGPWTAAMALAVVVAIQALAFGDGGITALGANITNIAFVLPFASYGIFKVLGGQRATGRRAYFAAFMAGYLGLALSAISTAIMLGIQPLIARSPEGVPLYAPYPLEVAVPVMAAEHLLFFGIIEGVITALVFVYFLRHDPGIIYKRAKEEGQDSGAFA